MRWICIFDDGLSAPVIAIKKSSVPGCEYTRTSIEYESSIRLVCTNKSEISYTSIWDEGEYILIYLPAIKKVFKEKIEVIGKGYFIRIKELYIMERVLNLKNADIKYWLGEYPCEKEIPLEEKSYKYKILNLKKLEYQKMGIEIFLHKDVSSYGLLGLEYVPDMNSDVLGVKINYIRENTVPYHSDLFIDDSYTYYGLPEECVEEILRKIQKWIERNEFSGGELRISIAANNEVRSSPKIFGEIAEILLDLIAKNAGGISK